MFSQACVTNSVQVCTPPPWGDIPWADSPLPPGRPPLGRHGYFSGLYASYWNVFLLQSKLQNAYILQINTKCFSFWCQKH